MTRINPYPPSFNKTAAKIMDPSKGASTWALGSQRWVKNIGSFTRKASIKRNDILNWSMEMKEKWKEKLFFIDKMQISRGKDAVIV